MYKYIISILSLLVILSLIVLIRLNNSLNETLKKQEENLKNKIDNEENKNKLNKLREKKNTEVVNKDLKVNTLEDEIDNNKKIQNEECKYYKDKEEEVKEEGTRDALGREVFWVGPNKYTFKEAKAVCEKLGSRLASEEEVNRAHKLGANWCDYGWIDGQKAFFIVQEDFHKLMDCKKKPNSSNPCGNKPGVHGGKMFNPDLKYGATCFGFKPPKTEKQKKREEEYNKILKNALGTLYKEPTPEQIKEMEDQRYKNILDNLKKDQLVNEVYEFNDLKVKWNNTDNNNIVSIES